MGEAISLVKPVSILALTITLALVRPQLSSLRIGIAGAALIGATLTILTGAVKPDLAVNTVIRLLEPLATIVSLMTITMVAARVGLLDLLSDAISRAAAGNAKRLFLLLFWSGTAVGALFTNDAAILLFTPMVLLMMERVSMPGWGCREKMPFYFAVLYVGNLVGAFVISNPINIIAASFFDIDFLSYALWMFLPALTSMLVSYWGLRWAFRKDLPARCRTSEAGPRVHRDTDYALIGPTAVVLVLTLLGFLTERLTGVPIWSVAGLGAISLLALLVSKGVEITPVLKRIDWHVLIFVCGIIIVTVGLRNAGVTAQLAELIRYLSGGGDIVELLFSTSLVAAVSSAFINNHSTVGLMIWVIEDVAATDLHAMLMVFAALIGGDLGPKMLPIGSLAALMWFRMLDRDGVKVSVAKYVAIGIPVTLTAVVASTTVLAIQWLLFVP